MKGLLGPCFGSPLLNILNGMLGADTVSVAEIVNFVNSANVGVRTPSVGHDVIGFLRTFFSFHKIRYKSLVRESFLVHGCIGNFSDVCIYFSIINCMEDSS